jgi:hypothetical protein
MKRWRGNIKRAAARRSDGSQLAGLNHWRMVEL